MIETKSTFEDLEVWKMAKDLRKKISSLVKTFPVDEKYRLTDQMIRASRSVTANIAEGYGRYHYQENMQFSRQARGSLYEILDHLTVAVDEEYIVDDLFEDLRGEVFAIVKKLNGYIQYLDKRKNSRVVTT
jgi:four helix bundle protein